MIEYANIVHAQARRFFWQGADREDVEQEAWLALVMAQPASPQLAKTIIRRRLRDRLRNERRRPQFAEFEDTPDRADIVDLVAARDTLRRYARVPLSDRERAALARSLNGEKSAGKSDENALQRARRKLKESA